jgi:hypothetical protein
MSDGQTTNLGVSSSNLFGRASYFKKLDHNNFESFHDIFGRGMQAGNAQSLDEPANWLKRLLEPVERWVEANADAVEALLRKAHHHFLFKEAGWLPHHTTPFVMVHDEWSPSVLSAFLDIYYLDNWPRIRKDFEKHLVTSKVDDEAKATFLEALEAHGLGLYRVAPRLLFPEIERLARNEFRPGQVGRMPIIENIRDKVERQEIGLSELAPAGGEPFFAQFERMAHHLYETVLTPEKLAALTSDPVPNRHAALHGLISYRTMKTSLNALIMTEFMYRIIPLVNSA